MRAESLWRASELRRPVLFQPGVLLLDLWSLLGLCSVSSPSGCAYWPVATRDYSSLAPASLNGIVGQLFAENRVITGTCRLLYPGFERTV